MFSETPVKISVLFWRFHLWQARLSPLSQPSPPPHFSPRLVAGVPSKRTPPSVSSGFSRLSTARLRPRRVARPALRWHPFSVPTASPRCGVVPVAHPARRTKPPQIPGIRPRMWLSVIRRPQPNNTHQTIVCSFLVSGPDSKISGPFSLTFENLGIYFSHGKHKSQQ